MQLVIIICAILVQVFLTVKKVSPFLSLLIVALLAGLFLGMKPEELVKSVEKGAGSTLGGIVFIFCLGAALGKVLEKNGAIIRIANTLISGFGKKNIQWAIMLTGFIIGIPLFYNAGFILLVPLVFTLARTAAVPLLYLAIPMAASLSVTHCFLPPHPGPVVLVNALHADMGKTLLYGMIIAIPVVIIAGPLLGRFVQKMQTGITKEKPVSVSSENLPSAFISFLLALLPVLLISLAVLIKNFYAEDDLTRKTFLFLGDPVVALLIALLAAILYTALRKRTPVTEMMQWIQEAISGIAMILLIITAGGVFKQVITDSGTADYIAAFSSNWHINPILFAWSVTALLRVVIGSATVAGLTAAGIVAPLLVHGYPHPELLVLAVGTGSVFGSHVNDTGFWMFREFFGLTLKQTFLSWTLMESLISVLGLAGVLLLEFAI